MTLLVRRSDLAFVECNGREIQTWLEYELTQDLLVPGGAFTFSLPLVGTVEQRHATVEVFRGSDLRVYVYLARDPNAPSERALQLYGTIKKLAWSGSRAGTTLNVQGNDLGSELAAASCDPRVTVTSDTVFVDVVRQLCAPFGVDVVADGVRARAVASGALVTRGRGEVRRAYARALGVPAGSLSDSLVESLLAGEGGGSEGRAADRSRRGHGNGLNAGDVASLSVTDAKPASGETVWEYIDRHARRFGVLPWMSAEGDLVLSAPDYDQEPSYRLLRRIEHGAWNNIIEGGIVYDYSALTSEVTVFGRTASSDASRSRFHATVTNPTIGYRPLFIHDPSVRSEAEAERRADREIARQNEKYIVLEYEVRDHGQGDRYFAIDTIAEVDDEELGISGEWYVVGRTLRKSRKDGTTTRLRLVPKGAITP